MQNGQKVGQQIIKVFQCWQAYNVELHVTKCHCAARPSTCHLACKFSVLLLWELSNVAAAYGTQTFQASKPSGGKMRVLPQDYIHAPNPALNQVFSSQLYTCCNDKMFKLYCTSSGLTKCLLLLRCLPPRRLAATLAAGQLGCSVRQPHLSSL
jgi:hypothetical protein